MLSFYLLTFEFKVKLTKLTLISAPRIHHHVLKIKKCVDHRLC